MTHDVESQQVRRRAVVAAVQLPQVSDVEFEASLSELRQLAKTLGLDVVGSVTQKRGSIDSVAYLGVGKRQELRRLVRSEVEPDDTDSAPTSAAADENGTGGRSAPLAERRAAEAAKAALTAPADPATRQVNVVLVDHEISPSRARNLEQEVGCEVMDRTMVILEIFHRHARSRAAKAQVEIVRLAYMAPRLREQAKLAGPQGRQRSGAGGRGAGESQGELERRKIRDRIAELGKEIEALDVERRTQRARRQEQTGMARVALVGYTNAGKSTLMRALTGSEVLVANKLFATLDTTVRALYPETVPRVLITDTVGFIKNLPHGLVASFKSTLEEALEASLLVHVIDASDPGYERQLAVTEAVLDEIGASGVPRLLVFNKIDGVGDAALQAEREAALLEKYPGCVVLSAYREGDVARLHAAIGAFFQQSQIEAELFLPWTAQQLRGEIFASCTVIDERADSDGAFLRVRGEGAVIERLQAKLGGMGQR